MLAIFDGVEMSGLWMGYLESGNKKVHGVSQFPEGTQPGAFDISTDNGTSWHQNNTGLPGTTVPPFALLGSSNDVEINQKMGLFENMNGS